MRVFTISRAMAVSFLFFLFTSAFTQNKEQELEWFSFQWVEEQAYNLSTPSRFMLADFNMVGIPEALSFRIDLSTPMSTIYDYTHETILYRNPDYRSQTQSVQSAGSLQDYRLAEVELRLNGKDLGLASFDVIRTTKEEKQNQGIKGNLGFRVFHQNQHIFVIDHPNMKFAVAADLPSDWEEKVQFVPFEIESGNLVLPIQVNGREVKMLFDGSPRPALVMHHSRTYDRIERGEAVEDSLVVPVGRWDYELLPGFETANKLEFKGIELNAHNMYLQEQRMPSRIRGTLSHAFFTNHILIMDFKNQRFGLLQHDDK